MSYHPSIEKKSNRCYSLVSICNKNNSYQINFATRSTQKCSYLSRKNELTHGMGSMNCAIQPIERRLDILTSIVNIELNGNRHYGIPQLSTYLLIKFISRTSEASTARSNFLS